MVLICVVLAVLLGLAASAASYFIAASRVLAKLVKKQERLHRRDSRRSDALLDRLIMKHGFTALTEPSKAQTSAVLLNLPIADPFEAAESEWEREDRERYRAMTALDDDEKADIITEARQRVS